MQLWGISEPVILSILKIGSLNTLEHSPLGRLVPGKIARYSTTDFHANKFSLKQINPFPV